MIDQSLITRHRYLPVVCNCEQRRAQAAALAREWDQPLLLNIEPHSLVDPEFIFLLDEQGFSLQQTGQKASGPVRAEFTQGAVDHRRKFGGGKGQMIAKAAGVKSGVYPRVLDVTAGLGKDAFVLASLGCPVQMLERSRIVHSLLADGLARARIYAERSDPILEEVLQRMNLIETDSRDYLEKLGDQSLPDVIYLDPMFPERQKTADVKKEMRVFHTLVGKDEDAIELLELARKKARYRVVVKRPRKAPFIGGQTPSYQLEGKTSRYDIYALKKLPDSLPQ